MADTYPSPATGPGTLCPCTPECDTMRNPGATYAPGGHDARAAAWLVPALGLTGPRNGETLCAEYGSVGAAQRAYVSPERVNAALVDQRDAVVRFGARLRTAADELAEAVERHCARADAAADELAEALETYRRVIDPNT